MSPLWGERTFTIRGVSLLLLSRAIADVGQVRERLPMVEVDGDAGIVRFVEAALLSMGTRYATLTKMES